MVWRVATFFAAASSSAANGSWVSGSGILETQSREVAGFSSVSLEGSGQLIIRQTGTESLSITADDNVLPHLTSTVRNGTLTLGTEAGIQFQTSEVVRYDVTVRELSGIDLRGSGTVAASTIDSPELRVDVSGSGTITMDGGVGTQEIVLSGSGSYLARDLQSRHTNVTISGSASATVAVSDTLDVTISGSGTVRYLGDPSVRQSIPGLGRVARTV